MASCLGCGTGVDYWWIGLHIHPFVPDAEGMWVVTDDGHAIKVLNIDVFAGDVTRYTLHDCDAG
jgi:3D (Asp-Asp-Asp) domain-containing protein